MKVRRVVYADQSHADISRIMQWLAETASPISAFAVMNRVLDFTDGLGFASERGQVRNDIRPGLRIVPFERAVVAFTAHEGDVTILRIFYGGEDWETAMRDEAG